MAGSWPSFDHLEVGQAYLDRRMAFAGLDPFHCTCASSPFAAGAAAPFPASGASFVCRVCVFRFHGSHV